jgi:hypothetical protein
MDLFVIIYRFQGVADKIFKAHSTVLVKKLKYRVRSERVLGWIGSKGVFCKVCHTHEKI